MRETGVAPYDGWTGNQNQNLYGKELTKAIRQDLQKVLCEGDRPLKKSEVSIRQGRGGYTTSLYITITADRHSDLIATDKEIRERVIDNMRHGERHWVGKTFNIYYDNYRAMPDEEQRQVEQDTADTVMAEYYIYAYNADLNPTDRVPYSTWDNTDYEPFKRAVGKKYNTEVLNASITGR